MDTSVQSVSIPKREVVTLGEKQVEVKTLPVGKYLEIIARLEQLPALAIQFTAGKSDDIMNWVVAAIQVAQDEFFDIVALASGLEKEYIIGEVGLYDLVVFVEKLIEVNRIPEILGKLRAAFGGMIKSLSQNA